MKTCSVCSVEKPLEEFHKSRYDKQGVTNRCKACKQAYSQKWYEKNRERLKFERAAVYSEKREEILRRNRAYYLRRRYGHSEGDVQ